LFTSDTEKGLRQTGKIGFIYLVIALFCVLVGAIYEHFSHGVYSAFMVYAFVFPLAGGALPFMAMGFFRSKRLPDRASLNLYNSGIATLTVGSIMQGVLEIFGTTNDLLEIYWFAGLGFILIGLAIYIAKGLR